MEEKNFLTVYNENNEPIKIEVIDIFTTEKYPDKQYILYTQGESEGEYIKSYVAILNEDETTASIDAIEDSDEFDYINNYINSIEG